MGVLFLLFFVLVAHASSSAYNTQTPHDSRLLILFLDGLRWDYSDYLDKAGGIGQMRTLGCHVPHVKPVFPANCYSNMHALFAGTSSFHYCDFLPGEIKVGYSFAIGHNSTDLDVFDVAFKANYTHPELLWNKAVKQGKSVKLLHFPFCLSLLERGIDCVQLTNEHVSLDVTLKDALQSLRNRTIDLAGPAVSIITLDAVVVYYGGLDRVAHARGPSSEELKHGQTILKVDEAISNIIQSLQALNDTTLNFAVVSDHGMIDFKEFLVLDRLFKWMLIDKVVNFGSAVGLWPKPDLEKNLTDSLPENSHFHVYTPWTMPVTSWRQTLLPPIVLIADPGYVFQISYHPPVAWDHLLNHDIFSQLQGVHGYLPDVTDMHTTFMAYGPAFEFGCGEEQGILYTYDLFPLLNSALFGKPVIDLARGGPETGWEMKLLGGILFTLFAVVLILGLALRRLLRIGRKHVNSPLVYDFEKMREYEEEDLKAEAEMEV